MNERSTASLEARFMAKVRLEQLHPDVGACWVWTGSVNGTGYPQIWRGVTVISARAAAWEIATDEAPPPRLRFRVSCGEQLCVNPDHVRPVIADEAPDGVARWLARWNASHDRCVAGHELTFGSTFDVPGGKACRECRHAGELRRLQRRRGDHLRQGVT